MISVIVPVFNREKLLTATLQSVREQSLQSWECIIVDDGSTDNSLALIRSFCEQDRRFKLLQREREPKGAPTCRNIGWQNAKNDYIVFLDSDDLLAPWALEERFIFFEENKTCDYILSPAMEFSKTNNKHFKYRSNIGCREPLMEFLSFQSVWQTSCPTWKKSALETINGWDEEAMSWQDGELHIRALIKNITFKWSTEIPDIFLRIDRDMHKITHERNYKKITNNVIIFKKILLKLDKENQKIFNKHIEIWFYRLVENANKIESKKLHELSKQLSNDAHWKTKKIRYYNNIYQATKNIPGLRKLIYLIREIGLFFPHRKDLFIKYQVPKTILNKLKLNLQGSSLERELACLKNQKNT